MEEQQTNGGVSLKDWLKILIPVAVGGIVGFNIFANSFQTGVGYTNRPEALAVAGAVTVIGWGLEALAGRVLSGGRKDS